MRTSTILREYQALCGLVQYDFHHILLEPTKNIRIRPVLPTQATSIEKALRLNSSQAIAIATILQRQSGVALIQGPPGTGKTRMIIGLLSALLSTSSNYVNPLTAERTLSSKQRVLVCAPSNAAIDELTRRIRGGLLSLHGSPMYPSAVRIGTSEGVHESVRDLTLDSMVDLRVLHCLSDFLHHPNERELIQETLKTITGLNDRVNRLRKMLSTCKADQVQTEILETQLKQVSDEKLAITRTALDEVSRGNGCRLVERERGRVRKEILVRGNHI
jgi:senataxin